ncbi:MAG: zinc ribbon domain-containing protein [Crenarchaeota archaeon]|nr:zinc ribbon domain-containing protein [Thermoproteota archaeon]MDA1124566.1 zinc ribbon domain-containing protein [Thermoproteota archaeon]
MSLGAIDTYNLTFDKLQTLFAETQGYYESFLDSNNLYKAGKISDKQFFQKLGDYTAAYSALLFLGVNSLTELKKTLDKVSKGARVGGTQSPGLMPGIGQPGMMYGMNADPRSGTPDNPVGAPPSLIGTAPSGFNELGTLPSPDPSLLPPRQSGRNCTSCGGGLRPNAKFCTKCGSKQ